MEKKVSFSMNKEDVIVAIKADDNPDYNKECTIKNHSLNAREIYDLLDYKPGDTYTYEDIRAEGKDKLVLDKLMEFFKSITDQITSIVLPLDLNEFEQSISDTKDK